MRPSTEEFAPFYASYVARVPDGDIATVLRDEGDRMIAELRAIPEARGAHRYAPGKWSIKDVVLHIADAERIFAYRALRIARGDETPLAAFDENAYTAAANADARPLSELVDELAAVRAATVALFRGIDAEAGARRGTASQKPVSARALGYIAVGHAMHHMAILRERYL